MLQQKKTAIEQDRAAVFQLIYKRQHSSLGLESRVEERSRLCHRLPRTDC